MSLAFLVPVLARPHRVAPLLDAIEATTPGARVLFLADDYDRPEHEAIERELGRTGVQAELDTSGGNYATKINSGVELTDEPYVFTGADDLRPHAGWLEAALAKLADGIGVVGTNDLCNPRVIAGEHATHFLMTREYAGRPCIDGSRGPLFEGYPHEYVDNELIETAKHRGAYAHSDEAIVEHLHPMAGKAPMDDLYAASGKRMREGLRVYQARQHLWT